MRTRNAAYWTIAVLLLVTTASVHLGSSQTQDDATPAEEESCTKYLGEGARYGLCVAYCEAQDCDKFLAGDPSCKNLAQNFIDWSVKKGFVLGPKSKPTISCKPTACTPEDAQFCGGRERDCLIGGECTSICTSQFEGFNQDNKPLCATVESCTKCVSDVPKIH